MSTPQQRWTDAFLDTMRQEADPAADQVVADVYARDAVNGVNRLLMNSVCPAATLPAELQEIVHRFLTETAVLPSWADEALIERCEGFFSEHGLLSSAILCCASLPECYLDAYDAPVLASTTQLVKHVNRRVLQTAHMVVSTMQPGGMRPNGPGLIAAQRVRLMHSAVRHLLVQQAAKAQADGSTAYWDGTHGKPINQESMAFVILTFSYVGIRAIETLCLIDLDDPEDRALEMREAYVHTWSVIGHVMGVREDLLAHSYEEAKFLFEAIKRRRKGASASGKELSHSLMQWMEDVLPFPLKSLPRELTVQLIGEEDAALLGITLNEHQHATQHFWEKAMHVVADIADKLDEHPALGKAAMTMFHFLTNTLFRQNQQWTDGAFALPVALQEAWTAPTERQQNLDKVGSESLLSAIEADSPGTLISSIADKFHIPGLHAHHQTQPTRVASHDAGLAADSPGF